MRAVLGHGLLPGLRPVRLHFGFAAERERHDRKRIQDEEGFLITTRPPKRGRSRWRTSWLQQMAIAPKPPTLPMVIQTLKVFSSSPLVMDESQPPSALWYR